jgi:hypothetical protein
MGWSGGSFDSYIKGVQMIEPIPFAGMVDWFHEIVPLTDEQIKEIYNKYVEKLLSDPDVERLNFPLDFAREIEKAHGII